MSELRFKYQEPNCPLTLSQGLEEYRIGHPSLIKEDQLNEGALELFHNHDICHVVFALDTNLTHEAMADTWTILGTDVGFFNYVHYLKQDEAKQLIQDIGIFNTILTFFKAIPKILKIIFLSRKMNKKWPWLKNEEYLDKPLNEIREEFGIHVIQ